MIMTYIINMLTFTKTSLLVIEITEVSFLYHPRHTKERNNPGQSRVKTKDLYVISCDVLQNLSDHHT